MRFTISDAVRAALLAHPEGLTVETLAKLIGHPYENTAQAVYRTYGCYIKTWTPSERAKNKLLAIWVCVRVPVNAPKTEIRASLKAKERQYLDDIKEAKRLQKLKLKKEAEAKLRRERKEANAKIKAQAEAEKAAAKARREAFKLEQQKIKEAERALKQAKKQEQKQEQAQYVPQKTRWVTPPPWMTVQ